MLLCDNEEKIIGKVVTDFRTVLPEATIYVYDNNSTDNSVSLVESAGAIVRREFHQGKGNVVRRMFREIDAEAYIMVDADDTYPAEAAPEMVRLILERHADMVVGDRLSSTYAAENKRPFHEFGNNLVRSFINRLFHSDIRDIMTGYRVFGYEFVKTYPVTSSGFEIETEMTIHAVDRNLQVENVVVEYRDRPEGSESKLNTFTDGMKVLKTIVKLYRNYRPLGFFGAMAAVLAILSIAFFIPVWIDFMENGMVARFPTLIACGIVMVMALLLFIAGVILSTLRDQNKRDFEFKLVQARWMKENSLIRGTENGKTS